MAWVTASEKAKQVEAQKIKSQLAALDENLPRCLEIIVASNADALAEIIDDKNTTRGDVLQQKQSLRNQLKELK